MTVETFSCCFLSPLFFPFFFFFFFPFFFFFFFFFFPPFFLPVLFLNFINPKEIAAKWQDESTGVRAGREEEAS